MPRTRHRAHFALPIAIALLVTGCGGPCGPFPGGRLAGLDSPYPSKGFAAYREIETVAVEVRGTNPHSVQTWVIVLGDRLYLPADFINPGKRWPFMALEDPDARLRIGEEIFEGTLRQVTAPERVEALRRETARKYEIEEDSWMAGVEVWWFRFDPRDATARSRVITEVDRGSPHNADNR